MDQRIHFENDIEMNEFDRDILEELVEKVVIGAKDVEGNPRPYVFTFVFKSGIKFSEEFYDNVANQSGTMEENNLSTYPIDVNGNAYSFTHSPTRGDLCSTY